MHLIARIDLIRLARHLQTAGKYPALVQAIDRAAAAGSIRDDLNCALQSLEQIVHIQDGLSSDPAANPIWLDKAILTGSLFVQAIILYARATATAGDRRPLLGEAKLTAEQRATHDEAMAYRNSAIAHFGRGETFTDGPIVKEAVVLSLYLDGSRPKKQVGVYTTRAQHRVAFSARLASLLTVRLAEIEGRYQKLFNEADTKLEEAVRADSDLGRSLRDFEFDVDQFCASPEAAIQMRADLDAGSVSDRGYEVRVPKP